MQFLKGSKLYSIFTGTCPVCHKGDMYLEHNPYKVSKIMKMHDTCSHCEQKFKIEPSFYFGAMYVSYGVGCAIAIAAFIITYFIIGLDRDVTFLIIILCLILLYPPIVRISRNIWINFFVDYDKNKAKQQF
ncbi:DUF983 domain-containing protein [Aequorivita sp. F47161]|uniref:DUF983 domain-containing protein n=1 Tax=Aequorivita vitellina TaxID=2874475 RepID=A0A9X1U9I1_9FLAO|nr:DUF983 domain-containing protein [Aequorivita vitellina]MCG2418566.1 DUF983 domain-containing protein [Aequorivita vitellina]